MLQLEGRCLERITSPLTVVRDLQMRDLQKRRAAQR
jgi:hypothetical protein